MLDEAIRDILDDAVSRGWSLRQIAESAGVPAPTVSRFAAGTRSMNLDSAARIVEWAGSRLTKPRIPDPPS